MLMPNADELPDGAVVTSRLGTRFRVHRDGMFRELFLFGDYESVHSRVFRSLIRPGDVVLDVGANFGWYTAAFARWVGLRGSVHAFEPVPSIAQQTRDAIELNGVSDIVRFNQTGLGSEAGAFVVYTFAGLPHGYASSSDLGRDDAQPHDCRVTTLDAYVAQANLARVDFIKIDVEGHELEALKGGDDLLSREDAPIVAFETNKECLQARDMDATELQNHLMARGYTTMWSVERTSRIREVNGPIPNEDCDYVAVKSSRREAALRALKKSGIRFG